MPIITTEDKSFLFIHIPKTGGTTIEKTIMKSNDHKLYYRTSAGMPINKFTICTPQHFQADLLRQIFKIKAFSGVFTIVRNPYDRIKSEYAMRNKKLENIKGNVVYEWLSSKVEKFKTTDPYVNDNHIRPQHEFILPNTKIFKLEDGMESIFKSLKEYWNLNFEYDPEFKVMTSHKVSGYPSSEVELNADSMNLINEFYKRDFTLFGYKMNHP